MKSVSKLLVAVLLCFDNISWIYGEMLYIQEKKAVILKDILDPAKYMTTMRPPGRNDSDTATVVNISMYILSIDSVCDTGMDYSLQLYFRQKWMDRRLSYNSFNGKIDYIGVRDVDAIWTPDLFFVNEKNAHYHDVISPNYFIRIFPDGTVLYSVRLSLTLSCPMDLKMYPFDTQNCFMEIESYGMKMDEMVLEFIPKDPVGLGSDTFLRQFNLIGLSRKKDVIKLSTGTYSRLTVKFHFKRMIGYYVLHLFIPSSFLVITSWISFWFEPNNAFTRVFIGLTILLANSLLSLNMNANMPQVSYTRAVDIWIGVCITFIFATLLEFVTVCYLRQLKSETSSDFAQEDNDIRLDSMEKEGKNKNEGRRTNERSINPCKNCMLKFATISNHMDIISRYIFPSAFSLFAIIYFTTNLSE